MSKPPLTHTSYSPKARAVAAAHQGENARAAADRRADGVRATTPTPPPNKPVSASALRDAYTGRRQP